MTNKINKKILTTLCLTFLPVFSLVTNAQVMDTNSFDANRTQNPQNNNWNQNYPNNNWNNNWNGGGNNNWRDNDERYYDNSDNNTNTEINSNGDVVLRGARVLSVSGNSMYVSSTIGNATLTWRVYVDGNTKLQTRNGRPIRLNNISVGDKVTVRGDISSGSTLVLRADLVRDISRIGNNYPNNNWR